jgi:hypothetical protein
MPLVGDFLERIDDCRLLKRISTFGDEVYLDGARQAVHFICDTPKKDSRLLRGCRDGEVVVLAENLF